MKALMIMAALAMVGAAHAGDIAAGRKLSATCAACHGDDFNSPKVPGSPRLAGQYADYLEKSLIDYQTGARKNAIMSGIAKPLSRADIRNLSAYFASLPGDLTHRK